VGIIVHLAAQVTRTRGERGSTHGPRRTASWCSTRSFTTARARRAQRRRVTAGTRAAPRATLTRIEGACRSAPSRRWWIGSAARPGPGVPVVISVARWAYMCRTAYVSRLYSCTAVMVRPVRARMLLYKAHARRSSSRFFAREMAVILSTRLYSHTLSQNLTPNVAIL
jgi:hypothetical protein